MSLTSDLNTVPTSEQLEVIEHPIGNKIFLSGQAGTGKTTAGVLRLSHFLDKGIPGNTILLLFPSRTLASPYLKLLTSPTRKAGGEITWLTLGGLARRMIDQFWPYVVEPAGFSQSNLPPIFLTLETAQYYMSSVVNPLLSKGFFQSVTIDRNRLYSQIIDNLNKAAVVGFPYTTIGDRLKSAWIGDPGQIRIFDDVQECVNLFRQFCLEHNLLDFSLQIEIFNKILWPSSFCQHYLTSNYHHIIFDNVEEDTPVAHDIVQQWLPKLENALLIYDTSAGYRRFLGADPILGEQLSLHCDQTYLFSNSLVMNPEVQILRDHIISIAKKGIVDSPKRKSNNQIAFNVLKFEDRRFFPAMLDWVVQMIDQLIHNEGVSPGEIAVLSPFLSDSLRFSLTQRLEQLNIPSRSHRPSRSLHEEPVTHCLFTLALIAHPHWFTNTATAISCPNQYDFAYALVQAIQDLDLIRAQLLANIVFRVQKGVPHLTSFNRIIPQMQNRITYWFGEKFETLRMWIENYKKQDSLELDHFFNRLFGEVLSQPGFGFHNNLNAGVITANLIESIQKFRWSMTSNPPNPEHPMGLDYYEMLSSGVIAAQFIRSWEFETEGAVLLAPAYTFLMNNHPVDYQFWLDIGSRGWSERLYQPLTHPYVLSRHWPEGQIWTDVNEVEANREVMVRMLNGLLAHCRKGIYLGLSQVNEQGYEQKGPLLMIFQNTLRQLQGS